MKPITKLRIGGVPEHFNLPWHLAINSGAIANIGIGASWQDFPGGTGSMVSALNAGEVDVAMLLTEGAIKGAEQGGDFEIISFYTQTPLIWGIHVPANSDLTTINDLEHATFAISRFGSGSHLMAYLFANDQGWDIEKLSFEVIGNLDGARELFKQGGQHVFLWEKFMTQPMVDRGEFRRISDFPTPWPCFVVCVRQSILKQHKDKISEMLKLVFTTANELENSPIAAKLIASDYGLKIPAVEQWLSVTKWPKDMDLDPVQITGIKQTLKTLNLI